MIVSHFVLEDLPLSKAVFSPDAYRSDGEIPMLHGLETLTNDSVSDRHGCADPVVSMHLIFCTHPMLINVKYVLKASVGA